MLTIQNAKTIKGELLGFLTGILYLAPANVVAGFNACPASSPGCRASCLYSAGRGKFTSVQEARIRKSKMLRDDPNAFMAALGSSIDALIRKAKREGLTPCVRLNGTSDVAWHLIKDSDGLNVFQRYSDLQFYDYTKWRAIIEAPKLPNYHLTVSRSETNQKLIDNLPGNVNYSVVFGGTMPQTFGGREVIDGTTHDLRFLDKMNVVVGLRAIGKATKDLSGFVLY